MYFCVPDSPYLLHPISILTWKDGFLCVALCVSSSHSTSGPTPFLKCAHASVHYFMSLPECTCLFHPIWRVSWKHGCPWCGIVCVCYNQPISGHTALLECVHAWVHVCMFIWLLVSVWCPVDNYMERGVPLCTTVCQYSSKPTCGSFTFVRMCTCMSTCIYVHLTPQFHLWCPVDSYPWKMVCHCVGTVCVSQSLSLLESSPWLECPPDSACVLHPHWIPSWKYGDPFVALSSLSHLTISGPTPYG